MGVDYLHEKSSLGHLPSTDRWVFDEAVTEVFPDMLKRSIPQLDVMRQAVFDLGSQFVRPGAAVVDLGCSLGDSLAPFVGRFGGANRYLGVEISEPMLRKVRERFATEIRAGVVEIRRLDLGEAYPLVKASLTLCILTLQFVSAERRAGVLQAACESTEPGGALILVEKILGASEELDDLMIARYHALKHANGYSWKEIEVKRDSLAKVLLPLNSTQNIALLEEAGFNAVDCFWRWMNFAGYIAIKR